MDASDLPLCDGQKAAEIRQMNMSGRDNVDCLLKKARAARNERLLLAQKGKQEPVKVQGAGMENQGQIVKMAIPTGWSLSTVKHTMPASANFVEYNCDANQAAKLCTYYRGHRISAAAGKHFHELLAMSAHDLSGAEYASLKEVLRDKSDAKDFTVETKKTTKIKGKMVLLVEGKFNAIKQDSYAIYLDAEDTGEVVQEIFYQAPQEVYADYLKAAEAAIESIVWK